MKKRGKEEKRVELRIEIDAKLLSPKASENRHGLATIVAGTWP